MIERKTQVQPVSTRSERGVRLLFLALGTNLGRREELMDKACQLIGREIGPIVARSRNFVTQPVGFESENLFLNAAVAVKTDLPIQRILEQTQEMEREMGRTRKSVNGVHYDRPMDIDLLFYGEDIIHNDRLILPHAHLHERRFVLEPLCDIAPEWEHPTLHKTMKDLLDNLNLPHITELQTEDCTDDNLRVINHLLSQLDATVKPLNGTQFHQILSATHIHIFVVRNEQKAICGMATLTLDPLLTGTKAWIEDVVVDHECRGRGYAQALINRLMKTAQREVANSVNLTSRPTREAANRLYRRCGFVQRETNVYKWLCTNEDK